VLEAVVIGARFAQYAAAAILIGWPLFFLFRVGGRSTRGVPDWGRRGLVVTATSLLLATIALLMAQTAGMTGDAASAFRPSDLRLVALETQVGTALAVRLAFALALVMLAAARSYTQARLRMIVAVAVLAGASFAWSGHGAATEGAGRSVHLASDVVHVLAAGLWLGALPPLLVLVSHAARLGDVVEARAAHLRLAGFAGVGSLAVTLLVATGAVNAWFLVGPSNLAALLDSPYGRLLLVKLGLFGLMLGLAAANRFYLTPRLARGLEGNSATQPMLRRLRMSLLTETSLGLLILLLVAALGTMMPPTGG